MSIQLGGKDSPAAFAFKASADWVRGYFFNSNSFCASSPANFQSNLAPNEGWSVFLLADAEQLTGFDTEGRQLRCIGFARLLLAD